MYDERPGVRRLSDPVIDRSHLPVDHERAGAHPLPLRTFPLVATGSIVPNAVSGGEFRSTNPQVVSAFPTFRCCSQPRNWNVYFYEVSYIEDDSYNVDLGSIRSHAIFHGVTKFFRYAHPPALPKHMTCMYIISS